MTGTMTFMVGDQQALRILKTVEVELVLIPIGGGAMPALLERSPNPGDLCGDDSQLPKRFKG
jgi:hypothetical protein